MATPTRAIITMPPDPAGPTPEILVALLAWFSPAFPTGGFAYSHGLEQAVADGLVTNAADLADWVEAVLVWGAGWSDAVLLCAAHAAVRGGEAEALAGIADLAAALTPARERLAESLGQGEAFLDAVHVGWPDASPPDLGGPVVHAVAAGAATAGLGAPVDIAVIAYLNGFTTNLIAAGQRLGLCGQTGGVRILAALAPVILDLGQRAARATLDDLNRCALGSEIAAMRHEILETRVFIS
jgi:urease accessory protein